MTEPDTTATNAPLAGVEAAPKTSADGAITMAADGAASVKGPAYQGFYDDLDGTLAEAWRMLARGVADRRSPFHTPAVATTGLDGAPQVRTVVLRGVDVSARQLRFHTDVRSGKVAEITRQPRVAVMGYDAGHKIQLRLTGEARVHHGDDVAAAGWARSQARSRLCYHQSVTPGDTMATGGAAAGAPLADGYGQFAVVVVDITTLEWLYLAHAGHRRARFTWASDGGCSSTWLAP